MQKVTAILFYQSVSHCETQEAKPTTPPEIEISTMERNKALFFFFLFWPEGHWRKIGIQETIIPVRLFFAFLSIVRS